MPAEGRSPDPTQAREGLTARRLTMSLPTPSEMVEKLQTSLQTKAKAEPAFRFYALWDKVCRQDVLLEAYRRCRANAGAAGVDGETFERIEARGREQWLGTLREELISGRYLPKPLLRVWIPKSNGGQRPLGIPCINDRVVQMAAVLIIGPIFEADLLPQQYGFRPGLDAKMALRRVYWHVTQHGRREVVDADLRDYFTSIPHAPLLRSLSRRIADGTMLHIIKGWLTAPVVEVIDGRPVQTTEARRTKRGTSARAVSALQPSLRALSVSWSPRSPPSFLPRALAACNAALVRLEIRPASNSATAAICCNMPWRVGTRDCHYVVAAPAAHTITLRREMRKHSVRTAGSGGQAASFAEIGFQFQGRN
jgi:Reverse transcriptase (RNA-dependent DNA polymerase)